jgi:Flp pilus assembly protein TadD
LAHSNLAWWLATNADPKFRDPNAAVTHARKAIDLVPEDRNPWSNLGVALWRAGDLQTAVETLETADRMNKGGDHFHRFFLAMAYWQLGEKDKARRAYDQAVEWMDKNQPANEELRRFRAEAEEMLGVENKKDTGIKPGAESEMTSDP